ncbi:MAG: GTP cyclohydrolase IIa [Thermoproteota archaeon]|nr:GTP cyclohydrolase IIa [Thermoproteota archaeon]
MTYQTTVIKLEGYGPWTLQLGSDREHKLQILQSRIYSMLQKLFSDKKGLVFSNRFDEMIAITNQIDCNNHIEIHKQVLEKFKEVDISMAIGIDNTPIGSNKKASYVKNKKEYLISPFIFSNEKKDASCLRDSMFNDKNVKILHLDINNSTEITKNLSSYETTNTIIRLYSEISTIFLKEESLTFYLGGDNFMVIAKKETSSEKVKEIVEEIDKKTGIRLNCGIGFGATSRKAAELATKALDNIRVFRKKGKIINVYEEL